MLFAVFVCQLKRGPGERNASRRRHFACEKVARHACRALSNKTVKNGTLRAAEARGSMAEASRKDYGGPPWQHKKWKFQYRAGRGSFAEAGRKLCGSRGSVTRAGVRGKIKSSYIYIYIYIYDCVFLPPSSSFSITLLLLFRRTEKSSKHTCTAEVRRKFGGSNRRR